MGCLFLVRAPQVGCAGKRVHSPANRFPLSKAALATRRGGANSRCRCHNLGIFAGGRMGGSRMRKTRVLSSENRRIKMGADDGAADRDQDPGELRLRLPAFWRSGLRQFPTVWAHTPNFAAISLFFRPLAAGSTIRACFTIACGIPCLRISATNSRFSGSLQYDRGRFASRHSRHPNHGRNVLIVYQDTRRKNRCSKYLSGSCARRNLRCSRPTSTARRASG